MHCTTSDRSILMCCLTVRDQVPGLPSGSIILLPSGTNRRLPHPSSAEFPRRRNLLLAAAVDSRCCKGKRRWFSGRDGERFRRSTTATITCSSSSSSRRAGRRHNVVEHATFNLTQTVRTVGNAAPAAAISSPDSLVMTRYSV